MLKTIRCFQALAALLFLLPFAASAAMKGTEIRSAKADGYTFRYELIDLLADMKDHQGHDMSKMKSHHLMVYVTDPAGKTVRQAKVGYLVTGPDKAEQKVMAMFMEGGFGADIDLKAKGAYKVLAKVAAGDKTVKDEFTFAVK